MESFLYSLDVSAFRWVNEGWSRPAFDAFFKFITRYQNFLPFLVPWLLYLVWKGPRGRWLVLSLFFAVLVSDQTASHLVKYWVARVRPCNALDGVLTPAGKSSSYSFPSSHAANMGSSMFLLARTYPAWTWAFVLIALLVGLSRVYLGVHYPSDVLGGYGLGLAVGAGVAWGMEWLKTLNRDKNRHHPQGTRTPRKAGNKGFRNFGSLGALVSWWFKRSFPDPLKKSGVRKGARARKKR